MCPLLVRLSQLEIAATSGTPAACAARATSIWSDAASMSGDTITASGRRASRNSRITRTHRNRALPHLQNRIRRASDGSLSERMRSSGRSSDGSTLRYIR